MNIISKYLLLANGDADAVVLGASLGHGHDHGLERRSRRHGADAVAPRLELGHSYSKRA